MDRKVFVAIVDSEGIVHREVIGRQVVPNVARVMMARDRARKASQAKGKLMMARRKAKAKVTNGKHARHLKDSAITFRNGVTRKRIVSQKPKPRVKAKARVASMNLKRVYQKTLQLADLVCARLETVNMMNGSGTIVAK